MAALQTGYAFVTWNGLTTQLSSAAWRNNLSGIYKVNVARNGLISYKPASGFNNVSQLEKGAIYLFVVGTAFELPDALLSVLSYQTGGATSIPTGYSFIIWRGNTTSLTTSAPAWTSFVSGIFRVNVGRNGLISYKPSSGFNNVTQLENGQMYLFTVTASFDLPDAILVLTDPAVNQPPQIVLTASRLSGLAPVEMSLSANTSDVDGDVARVDYYAALGLLGTTYEQPHTLNFTAQPGTYNFSAVATDDDGAQTTSNLLNASFTPVPTITVTLETQPGARYVKVRFGDRFRQTSVAAWQGGAAPNFLTPVYTAQGVQKDLVNNGTQLSSVLDAMTDAEAIGAYAVYRIEPTAVGNPVGGLRLTYQQKIPGRPGGEGEFSVTTENAFDGTNTTPTGPPIAPTGLQVNTSDRTATFSLGIDRVNSDYEYQLPGGSYQTVTARPFAIGDAGGTLSVRRKATAVNLAGPPATAIISSVSGGGTPPTASVSSFSLLARPEWQHDSFPSSFQKFLDVAHESLEIDVRADTLTVQIETQLLGSDPSWPTIAYFVDGAYRGVITATAAAPTYYTIAGIGGTAGAAKRVRLVNGLVSRPDVSKSTRVLRVDGVNAAFVSPVRPTRRTLIAGDSIVVGQGATVPQVTGVAGQLRASLAGSGERVTLFAAGYSAAKGVTAANIRSITLDTWSRLLDGLQGNTLLLEYGRNDAGIGTPSTKAEFKTNLENLVTEFHALRPDARIVLVKPIVSSDAGGAESLQVQYRAAMEELAVTYPYLTVWPQLSVDMLADGVHPTQAGHDQMAASWISSHAALPAPAAHPVQAPRKPTDFFSLRPGALSKVLTSGNTVERDTSFAVGSYDGIWESAEALKTDALGVTDAYLTIRDSGMFHQASLVRGDGGWPVSFDFQNSGVQVAYEGVEIVARRAVAAGDTFRVSLTRAATGDTVSIYQNEQPLGSRELAAGSLSDIGYRWTGSMFNNTAVTVRFGGETIAL